MFYDTSSLDLAIRYIQPRLSFVFSLSRSLRVVTYPTLFSVSDTLLAQSRSSLRSRGMTQLELNRDRSKRMLLDTVLNL